MAWSHESQQDVTLTAPTNFKHVIIPVPALTKLQMHVKGLTEFIHR